MVLCGYENPPSIFSRTSAPLSTKPNPPASPSPIYPRGCIIQVYSHPRARSQIFIYLLLVSGLVERRTRREGRKGEARVTQAECGYGEEILQRSVGVLLSLGPGLTVMNGGNYKNHRKVCCSCSRLPDYLHYEAAPTETTHHHHGPLQSYFQKRDFQFTIHLFERSNLNLELFNTKNVR